MGFRAAAQDKLLVAGSGNPNILLLDKQTGKVEWQHALEKGEECNAVALTQKEKSCIRISGEQNS